MKRSPCHTADCWPVYTCFCGAMRELRRGGQWSEHEWSKCGTFLVFSSHLLNLHLKLSELTVAFAGSFWPFKGVSYSVVESLTSEYEEENQTQLKAKGQHAQHHYDVNCWRYGKQHAFQKTFLWTQIGLKTMFETFPSVTTWRLLCRRLPVGDLRLGQAQSQVFFLELFHPSGSSCSQITGTTQHRTNSDLLRPFPAHSSACDVRVTQQMPPPLTPNPPSKGS